MTLVGNTHLIAGGSEAIGGVLSLLNKEGIKTRGNPDVLVREYQRFGIEDARELRERASLRAVGDRRLFIVVTSGMTNEAQNALLKTLEDSPANAMFFFIVPAPQMLLPTLRSRAQMLKIADVTTQTEILDGRIFLAATQQQRLDMLKPLLEKNENDKRDIGVIITFLSSLERALAESIARPSAAKAMEGRREGFESVYRARKYIGDKGALVKPLLEQVALLVPQI